MTTPRRADTEGERRRVFYAAMVISLAVAALVAIALLPRLDARPSSAGLLALVLLALAAAIGLHVRFLVLVRREQRQTADALRITEHEFESVFDSALDGFLILDDRGVCLEANPAALALLGVSRDELVQGPIDRFQTLLGGESLDLSARKDGRGETNIIGREGRTAPVEYALKAHYLPGRHFLALRDVSAKREAEAALRESDERFRQMAGNIEEIFWMIDAQSKHVLYANRAFETITGRSLESLAANPISYQELFHPEDRLRVVGRLEEAATTGIFDEEFRIVRTDHAVRWVWVRGFAVRDSSGAICRLAGTAQDISARKSAEEQMASNLRLAESAWAEADALRKATLALTQNLSMDYVLDTLLAALLELVPCHSAQVLLAETEDRLFLAKERRSGGGGHRTPLTWNAADHPVLLRALVTRSVLLVRDTAEQEGWTHFKGHSHFRSWLCVPLVASEGLLGLLCLGDMKAYALTQEHLRLAQSLAIPAAVAIQNARLYERAEIYGAELEKRIADLDQAQQALETAEAKRALTEETFRNILRAGPVALSITAADDGRFIDVNETFEQRFGYTRDELIGRTSDEIGIWEDVEERRRVVRQIAERGAVRNEPVRLRRRSGEILAMVCSAQTIELGGEPCILAVTQDIEASTPLDALRISRAGSVG